MNVLGHLNESSWWRTGAHNIMTAQANLAVIDILTRGLGTPEIGRRHTVAGGLVGLALSFFDSLNRSVRMRV